MGLMPKPHASLTDADVVEALVRAVAVIDPLLDLLSQADPIGLRRRTHRLGPRHRLRNRIRRPRHQSSSDPGPRITDRALNAGAVLINAVDLPGTAAWDRLNRDQRIHWWVHRVGGLNTLLVASPGAFGWLARLFPVGQLAGFVNQAIVLCAVAREYGVTDQHIQVRLLGAVLCNRELPTELGMPSAASAPLTETPPAGWKPLHAITSSTPMVVTRTVWQLAGILRATFEEVAKRPQATKFYRRLGALPGLGMIAAYFGERGALIRSARHGEDWLADNSAAAAEREA